jgi:hypothetical protein
MALVQCSDCGQQVSDRAGNCPKCGAPIGYAAQQGGVTPPALSPYADDPQRPNNLLVWSILATVLCCPPTGIPAIVNSARVNNLWDTGDHEGAYRAIGKARGWCIATLILGIVFYLTYIIIVAVAGGAGLFNF